jgi:hypothetical protein
MPRRASTSGSDRDADYHDAHLDDPEEWEPEAAEDVQPRSSGMVVFSLRLPADEFALLRREAERRQTTMSELARTALRFYLLPRATGSLSVAAIHHVQVTSFTPAWSGGMAGHADLTPEQPTPPMPPLGNVPPPRPAAAR